MKVLLASLYSIFILTSGIAAPAVCHLPGNVTTLTQDQIDGFSKPAQTSYHFDGYLLALSWSPAYCAKVDNSERANSDSDFQCTENKFNFVVHGLWPEASDAPSLDEQPAFCKTTQPIAVNTLKAHLCTIPGVGLMHHEWAKHGSCAFDTPEEFLGRVEELRSKLRLPNFSVVADQPLTAGTVRDAFMLANPSLARNAIMVATDKKNRLQEVRLCYDKSFHFMACQRRGAPDRIAIQVTRFRG